MTIRGAGRIGRSKYGEATHCQDADRLTIVVMNGLVIDVDLGFRQISNSDHLNAHTNKGQCSMNNDPQPLFYHANSESILICHAILKYSQSMPSRSGTILPLILVRNRQNCAIQIGKHLHCQRVAAILLSLRKAKKNPPLAGG